MRRIALGILFGLPIMLVRRVARLGIPRLRVPRISARSHGHLEHPPVAGVLHGDRLDDLGGRAGHEGRIPAVTAATTGCEPTVREDITNEAAPLANVADPSNEVPSRNATTPEGVPATDEVTLASNVTAGPEVAGFGAAVSDVELGASVMDSTIEAWLPPWNIASPL